MNGAMDLRWLWLGNLAGVLGGGAMVFLSMMYTVIADISTDEQRTTLFFYLGTVIMGGSLVSHPVTYLAMQVGTWFAWGLGLALCTAATVVAFCMPETLDKTAAAKVDPVPLTETERLPLLAKLKAASVHTLRVIRWLYWEQKLVGFLLLSLTFEILGKGATGAIQQQYISKRYHLTFAEVLLPLHYVPQTPLTSSRPISSTQSASSPSFSSSPSSFPTSRTSSYPTAGPHAPKTSGSPKDPHFSRPWAACSWLSPRLSRVSPSRSLSIVSAWATPS
jgi:hypothetical protein